MSIDQYLKPLDENLLGYAPSEMSLLLGSRVVAYQPDGSMELPREGLLLVGVNEDRGAEHNEGCCQSPDAIRQYLYRLAVPNDAARIIDLGDIILGQTQEDTYYALSEVVATAVAYDCTLIILGGSQDLTFAAYKGYERMNRIINITSIDPRFDIEDNDEITSRTWLRNIIMQTPNYLFFSSNIGYQTHFVGEAYVKLIDDLRFDAYRVGEIQHDLERAETAIRNADLLSVDISCVRQSDAPGNGYPSPHGFYGEELCHLMRFAGVSDKTQCLGIFEVNPLFDNHGQTAHMVAQALWYFIEGFYNRQEDNPQLHPEQFRHFLVNLEDQNLDIDFYKSKLSSRWWVRVPCHNEELQEIYSSQMMLPCTFSDYQQAASNGEVPALWWRYFQRLNS